MNGQLGLFEGIAARDAAIALVDAHTDDTWREAALRTVKRLAQRQPYLASDDLWADGLPKPREPRAMGPVMMRAVREGWIERTTSTRPTSNRTQHAQPIRVYRSRLHVLGAGPTAQAAGARNSPAAT